jgi:hypothetical protein
MKRGRPKGIRTKHTNKHLTLLENQPQEHLENIIKELEHKVEENYPNLNDR